MAASQPANNPQADEPGGVSQAVELNAHGEITRLLWQREHDRSSRVTGQDGQLFSTASAELLKRFNGVLSESSFLGIRHRITAAELLSEFWMRFAKSTIETPVNSKQFFILAEKIVRNLLRDAGRAARSKKRFYSRLKQPLTDVVVRGPGNIEAETELNLLLSRLESKRAEAFRLIEKEGLSFEEAATRLKISKATVKRRVSDARNDLRCMLLGIVPEE